MIHTLQQHSFSLNLQKSHLRPITSILYLGAVIDPIRGQVYLSLDQQHSIKMLVSQIVLGDSLASPVTVARKNDLVCFDRALGAVACSSATMVFATIPENRTQQLLGQSGISSINSSISPMVDISGASEGVCVPGAQPHHSDVRCEPLWLADSHLLSQVAQG